MILAALHRSREQTSGAASGCAYENAYNKTPTAFNPDSSITSLDAAGKSHQQWDSSDQAIDYIGNPSRYSRQQLNKIPGRPSAPVTFLLRHPYSSTTSVSPVSALHIYPPLPRHPSRRGRGRHHPRRRRTCIPPNPRARARTQACDVCPSRDLIELSEWTWT